MCHLAALDQTRERDQPAERDQPQLVRRTADRQRFLETAARSSPQTTHNTLTCDSRWIVPEREHAIAQPRELRQSRARDNRVFDDDGESRRGRGGPGTAAEMFVAFRGELKKASEVIDELFDRKPHLWIGSKRGYRLIEVPHHIVGAAGSIVEKTAEAIARGRLRGVEPPAASCRARLASP